MKYEKLFEKGKIGNLPIKNRIVMTAMGTGFAAASGEASEEIIRYYEERAKGGVGLIITEVCRVDELSGIAQPCQLRGTDMNVIPSFTRLVDRVHAYGTKIFLQLQHPGNEAAPITLHGNPVIAPSPVVNQVIGAMPREMTTQEVEAMAGNFVKAAVIAKISGFDGVEVHAAHGYLINQFLSPHTNRRTDKYGGDFFNRMRFLSEIVVGIRFACGPDFPISVRIDGQEYTEYGMTEEECLHIARYLESLSLFWIEACFAAAWTQLLAVCVCGCIRLFRKQPIIRKPLPSRTWKRLFGGGAVLLVILLLAAHWIAPAYIAANAAQEDSAAGYAGGGRTDTRYAAAARRSYRNTRCPARAAPARPDSG